MPNPLLLSVIALAIASLAPATAAQNATPAQRPEVIAAGKAMQQQVIDLRRHFHQYPELSNREEQTAKRVAEELRKLGLRADMDALPIQEATGLPYASQVDGVMHACGHDAHTGILLGVAKALVGMQDTLPGEVLLVFQPAEEGAPAGEEGGAALMLKDGVFRDFTPEAVFGLHVFSSIPVGQIGVRQGPLMAASDSFTLKVVGRQTHGSRPWGGVDPIVAMADVIGTTQTIVSRRTDISRLPAVVSFGAIKGGIRYNIIPDDVEVVGTIRTFDEGMRQKIFADLKNVATHVSAAHGAKVEASVPDNHGNPVTVNDPDLTARMLPSLQAAVGADNVITPPLQMGAEDFSFYAREVPSMFFFVGSTAKGIDPVTAPSNHSPEFMLDEASLDVGLRALLQVTLDYLEKPKG